MTVENSPSPKKTDDQIEIETSQRLENDYLSPESVAKLRGKRIAIICMGERYSEYLVYLNGICYLDKFTSVKEFVGKRKLYSGVIIHNIVDFDEALDMFGLPKDISRIKTLKKSKIPIVTVFNRRLTAVFISVASTLDQIGICIIQPPEQNEHASFKRTMLYPFDYEKEFIQVFTELVRQMP